MSTPTTTRNRPLVIVEAGSGSAKPGDLLIQISALAVDSVTLEPLETFDARVWFDVQYADATALRAAGFDAALWTKDSKDAETVAKRLAAFLKKFPCRDGKNQPARLAVYHAAVPWWLTAFAGELALPIGEVLDIRQRTMWYFLDREWDPAATDLPAAVAKLNIRLKDDTGSSTNPDALRRARLIAGVLWRLRRMEKTAAA